MVLSRPVRCLGPLGDDGEAGEVVRLVLDVRGQDVEAEGLGRRRGWRRRRRTPRVARARRRRPYETTSMHRRLRQVLAQPVPALRQAWALEYTRRTWPHSHAPEQAMMHPHPDLGADLDARQADEHLQGVGDPAVGRVLQGHDAELDVTAIDLLEDRGDRADRDVLDGLAKLGDRGQVAIAVLRPQAGDAERLLERSRPAHQLAEDQSERLRRGAGPRSPPGRGQMTSSSRADDQTSSPCCLLDLADLEGDLGATVQERDESWSSLSIWPRRLARVGAGLGAGGRRGGPRVRPGVGRPEVDLSASVDSGRGSRCSGPIGSDVKRSAIDWI